MASADYADDPALLANISTQAESQLHSLEQAAMGVNLYEKAYKTKWISFKQKGAISPVKG